MKHHDERKEIKFFTRKNEIIFPKVAESKKITMVIKIIH